MGKYMLTWVLCWKVTIDVDNVEHGPFELKNILMLVSQPCSVMVMCIVYVAIMECDNKWRNKYDN